MNINSNINIGYHRIHEVQLQSTIGGISWKSIKTTLNSLRNEITNIFKKIFEGTYCSNHAHPSISRKKIDPKLIQELLQKADSFASLSMDDKYTMIQAIKKREPGEGFKTEIYKKIYGGDFIAKHPHIKSFVENYDKANPETQRKLLKALNNSPEDKLLYGYIQYQHSLNVSEAMEQGHDILETERELMTAFNQFKQSSNTEDHQRLLDIERKFNKLSPLANQARDALCKPKYLNLFDLLFIPKAKPGGSYDCLDELFDTDLTGAPDGPSTQA